MPELWDLYDIDRRPLNRTIQRGEALPEGTYHLAVGIAVFHTKGDILLTQRAQVKSQYPGCWEIPGGCAQAGETTAAQWLPFGEWLGRVGDGLYLTPSWHKEPDVPLYPRLQQYRDGKRDYIL